MSMKTTHNALRGCLILGQCFALMPVTGITKKNAEHLSFTWKSFNFIYCSIGLLLLLTNISFFVLKMSILGISLDLLVTFLFFGCAIVTSCLFMHLAYKWPKIINFWTDIDDKMSLNYGFPRTLSRALKITIILVIGTAALEHCFFLVFVAINMPETPDDKGKMQVYFENSFNHVFRFIPYSFIVGLTIQLVNIFSTFSWNYMDMFLMVISECIAARFAQITERISLVATKNQKKKQIWMEIREDYNRLNILVKNLNNALGNIVMLSFANNLFVILIQLLHSLLPRQNEPLSRMYFIYSFGFLIIRTVAVSVLSSKIHTESTKPAYLLNLLPNNIYNEEIDRLLMQIQADPSYLSGRDFFNIKKPFILSIAGAIVSYELILIEFHLR